jgi:arginine decarboxylase-like protein
LELCKLVLKYGIGEKMPIFKTQDLSPGVTLTRGVQSHSGRQLITEGTVLTEKHILNLKAWGVAEVEIQEEGAGSVSSKKAEKVDPQKLAKAQKETGALFCFSNLDHPAITELMRLSSLNRLKKMPGMGHVDVK